MSSLSVDQWIDESETNGFLAISYRFLREADSSESTNLRAALEAKLDELEQALAQYPGPYFLSTFGLVGYSLQSPSRLPGSQCSCVPGIFH